MSWNSVQRLSTAYFETFNLLHPVLDRHSFMSETMPSVFHDGFSQSTASTVTLLVLALGETALSASDGLPVHSQNGRLSGVKGGSKDRPPGLAFFNEAKRRMGFHLTACSIENAQMFILASVYYEACFYLIEHWRMATLTSQACRALIIRNPEKLSSPQGDLIRRLFWECLIIETSLHVEYGLPRTGLEKMETVVGLPDFSSACYDEDHIRNQQSHFQEHFASQIVLRRLLAEFHNAMSEVTATSSSPESALSTSNSSSTGNCSRNYRTIRKFAFHLEQWRDMLPAALRWQVESPGVFPNADAYMPAPISSHADAATSPATAESQTSSEGSSVTGPPLMFTTNLDDVPAHYPYGLDIQVATLRSRYYYTKYLVHRPFIYKALHYPDDMTYDDAVGAAECLKACLKWPVAMSPTSRRKRLVPTLFCFTQSLFGVLVVLYLSTTVPSLKRIRTTLCGERFEMDAGDTVSLYLDWLKDLKVVDCATSWQWDVVRALYGLEE